VITVTLRSAQHDGERWIVTCDVSDPAGTRCGPHVVELPETATEAELIAAIAALYAT
jgi:hypothetical protein